MATTVESAQPNLTSNDSAVLQALFDAETSPSSTSDVKIDSTLPAFPAALNITPEGHFKLNEREISIIKTLQSDPSQETIQTAISNLTDLINESPKFPSAYVDRAQALRMLIESNPITGGNQDEPLFTQGNSEHATTLFNDLSTSITLTAPQQPETPVSPIQAKLLADAYTHRGYLLLKAARVKKNLPDGPENTVGGPESLRGHSPDQLEEMASRDFFFGGRYGNEVARQLAVQTNPYAKMCGAIVKEALRKEVEGE